MAALMEQEPVDAKRPSPLPILGPTATGGTLTWSTRPF